MGHTVMPAVAASRYRQIRLTFTQEGSGQCSYALYAKGLNQAWSEPMCLIRRSFATPPRTLATTEDVIGLLLELLREELLPGID